MSPVALALADEYRATLRDHVRQPEPSTLAHAYELGCRALNERVGIPLLAQAYREVMVDALGSSSSTEEAAIAAEAAGQFFAESLLPFEMAYRSFRQTHAALRASEERYRDLFENASDIIFTIDLRGNLTSWNRRAEQILGYRVREDFPLHLTQILAPAFSHLGEKMVEEQRKSPGHKTYEADICTKDGRRVMVEVSTRLIYEDERPVGIHGIARDLTERKRAERIFHDVLEAAPDVMIVANDQGKIVYVNAEVEHIFGYRPAELVGAPMETLIPPRFHDHHSGYVAQFVEAPRRRPMGEGLTLFGMRKDGHEFPVDVSLGHLDSEEGMLLISTIRDITESKKTQQALQEMNVALEQEARRIAQVLHDESGQLLAAAHMLIDAMAAEATEAMRQQIEEVKGLLNETEEQIRRLSHELRPAILDDLGLRSAIEFLARGVSSRAGIEVQADCHIDRRLPAPTETAIYRVVQEALTNVLRHAQARHVCIHLEQCNGSIHGSVRDNGKGFDTQSLLQRGRTGLGLMGMRARMNSVGGKLFVSSQLGRGTDIQFLIEEGQGHAD